MSSEKLFYNSALRNRTEQLSAPPTEFFEWRGNIGARRNVITEPPLPEMRDCDVIYSEPPWPAGLKVFDARAKDETQGGYAAFARAFARLWRFWTVPRYAIVSKRLLQELPPAHGVTRVKLNGDWVDLAHWGGPPPEGDTNREVCEWLGGLFNRMGDPTAGYGGHLIEFAQVREGNTFVGTDYDPHCITVMERLARENLS